MPELPEVETIKRDLKSSLAGLYLESLDIMDSSVLTARHKGAPSPPPSPLGGEGRVRGLVGRQVKNIFRRGKFLLFELTGGEALSCFSTGETYMLLHLGMTGKLITGNVNGRAPRVRFKFHDGHKGTPSPTPSPPRGEGRTNTHVNNKSVSPTPSPLGGEGRVRGKTIYIDFIDTRRFGKLRILSAKEKNRFDDILGMEPLSSKFTPGYLNDKFKTRRAPVHAVLLDQKLIAGVGNIYATEALHIAGIHPERTASGLGPLKTKELFKSLKHVLKLGIKRRGSSIRDYVDAYGNPGTMQNYFKVYGKTICSNPQCKAVLERIVIRGRGVRFCPSCQK